MVRDGGRGAAPRQKTAAEIGVLVDRGRVGAGRDADGQRGGVRRTGVHPARRRTARQAGPGHDGAGPAGVHASDLLPDRGAGGAPRRRGRGRPRGCEPGHRGGTQLVRQQAGRRGRGGQPPDVLPGVLDRRPRPDGGAGGAGPRRRGGRADHHPGLDVRQRPGLGQPEDPGADGPGHHGAVRAAGPGAAAVAGRLRPDLPPAGPKGAEHGRGGPARAYAQWAATPPPGWDDVAWLAQLWGGPFLVKGIIRVDDAKRAVDAGASAISVSNHGGNDLDGTPATIRALPAVAAAVGGQAEVLLDGGIRRGGDVVKAVALGARAVMIGRAYLWGLAANGQAGVENVLDILRGGIDSALLGLGKAAIRDLTPDDIVVPPGFTRTLGGDGPVFDPAGSRQATTG